MDKKTKVIKGVKGFNEDMTCRGFQYKIGETYKEDDAVICKRGFHFCENPLDVFGYYAPACSKYAEVDGQGKISRSNEDSKVACTELKINAEISLDAVIKAGVEFVLSRVKKSKLKRANQTGPRSAATNTGNQSVATNTGPWSAATNTGPQSVATNTGTRSAATNTGNQSAATNTGPRSAATNTGNQSAATNTGPWSAATNTGPQSVATNTGNQSAATNTGPWSAATNTGNQSAATNTGNQSAATNTGNQSAATNTGPWSAATNTGTRSAATNTGYLSAAEVKGKQSIACGLGIKNRARGALGCWLVLTEWVCQDNEWTLVGCKSVKVDGKRIKADVWYTLQNGKFIKAEGNQCSKK